MKTAQLSLVMILSMGTPAMAGSAPKLPEVAKEIRGQIAAVNEAIAEATKTDKNLPEICFRVGNLYQSARHELVEAISGAKGDEIAKELIADGKSLPSFCGDGEKLKQDPGYEQVPKGDVPRLKIELGNMDRRAKALSER